MDPDARHTRKSPEARRDGYRAHVAADPETGIITDEKLTRAAGTENSDPAVAGEFLAAETAGDDSHRAGAAPGGRGPGTGDHAGPDLSADGLTTGAARSGDWLRRISGTGFFSTFLDPFSA